MVNSNDNISRAMHKSHVIKATLNQMILINIYIYIERERETYICVLKHMGYDFKK